MQLQIAFVFMNYLPCTLAFKPKAVQAFQAFIQCYIVIHTHRMCCYFCLPVCLSVGLYACIYVCICVCMVRLYDCVLMYCLTLMYISRFVCGISTLMPHTELYVCITKYPHMRLVKVPRAAVVNRQPKVSSVCRSLNQKRVVQDTQVEHEEAAVDEKSVHRHLRRSLPKNHKAF